MSVCWLILGIVFAACQTHQENLPPVEGVDHSRIQEIVAQNRGKVVLVNAWATWCEPCREEMPALVKLRKEFHDKGFELVLVSADEPELVNTKVRPMLQGFGVDFESYINTVGSDEAFIAGMSPKWNGALPTSFVYDRTGKLAEMMIGGKSFEQLKEKVVKLLGS